jgi:uncharacterized protein
MPRRNLRSRVLCCAIGLLAVTAATAAVPETYWPPITDPPTQQKHPGRWVWAELLTRDVATAAEFYGKVFDWKFETYGPKDDAKTYTLVVANGTPIGGMVFSNTRDRSMKRDARWVGLVSVADVEAVVGRVTAVGGKVLMAPATLGQRGRVALFSDPEGATFGVIDSATGDPEDYAGDDNQWLWVELWADDPAKMADFYQRLVGYEVLHGSIPGEESGFHLVSGGYARAGILPKPAKVPTTWVPYIRVKSVADTVAKARTAGGAVVMEPTAAHGTSVALLLDPTGAPVAVAEWTAPRKEVK